MEEIRRILVVSRMSTHCRDAVTAGLSVARRHGAALTVMHIISDPVDMEAVNAPGLFIREEEYKNYRSRQEEAREQIDREIAAVVKGGFPVTVVVKNGDAAEEVSRVVAEENIDLIVMLSQEEGRLEHFLFGGDNDAIIRRMPCNILLVKKVPEPVDWQ